MRRAAALAAVLVAGCGGDSDPPRPSAADQVRPPPSGYRYGDPRNPALERQFAEKVRKDLSASDVAVRNVYKGDRFVAGVIVARVERQLAVKEVAARVMPGPPPITVRTPVAGKEAFFVKAGAQDNGVIDTFGDFVLIVLADRGETALRIAAPMVR